MATSYMMELFVISCLVMIACFAFLVKWWQNETPYRNIPGPSGLPVLGNTLDFSGNADQHALLQQWAKTYGKIFKYYVLFGGYRIHITDPDIAKHILVKNCKNYRRQDILKRLLPGLGNGLITSNGRAHAIQRKQLNPFFSLTKVQRFFPVFSNKVNELIEHWTKEITESKDESIKCDVLEKLTHLTLDVVGLCAFGYHFNCILGGHSEESRATDEVLKGNFDLQRRSFEQMLPFLKWIPSKKQTTFTEAETCLRSLIESVIEERKMASTGHKNFGNETDKDLLTMLFLMKDENGIGLSSEDIYHQVFTFLITGHETTSLTATWTLYMLARHIEIQKKVRDEILNNCEGPDSEITWSNLGNLSLLENCIKEAMRLYPIAITTDRTAIGPDKIGPYNIPAGTHVMVGIGTLHRDETLWKKPNSFDPDRFNVTDNEEARKYQYYFLPFSRGPRMCIGYRFAMTELKVTLAKLLKQFAFSVPGQDQTSFNRINSISTLTLKPFPHLKLNIKLLDERKK